MILNVCMGLKNHQSVLVKHVKFIFIPSSEYLRMHTKNFDLILQKDSVSFS